jgi:hypothetical protein
LSPSEGSAQIPAEENAKQEHEAWWKKFRMPTVDKAKLATLGFGAFCAYGVISNVNAGVLITIAWLTVVRTTGAMPISPGMWPKFLAIYAGILCSQLMSETKHNQVAYMQASTCFRCV